MTETPLTKKIRLWNPALDQEKIEESTDEEKPLDFTQKTPPMPFFHNYFQLAPIMFRMQQQRHFEELARRQLMNMMPTMAQPRLLPPTQLPKQPTVSEPTTSTPKVNTPLVNPIVQSTLGRPNINENCCAVCGATFRLTGDLVQHMRNNHRKNKFKRKNDKN